MSSSATIVRLRLDVDTADPQTIRCAQPVSRGTSTKGIEWVAGINN